MRTNQQKWEDCTSHGVFAHNILIGASGGWPHQNSLDRSLNDVGFVIHNDGRGGDYHLQKSSRHKLSATDGRDPGADVDMVERAIRGAE